MIPTNQQPGLGANISNAIRGARQNRSLDEILAQIQNQQTPENIGQILHRLSPERQQVAMNALNNQSYQKLADTIEKENPNSSLHRTLGAIYRSGLPIDQKEKLTKNLTTAVPYRAEQQQRLNLDSVLKRYNSRIKEIDAELKTAYRKDRPALESQKKALQAERDYLLNFESLNQPKKQEKIKFDINNPEHMQIFEQFDEQFGGDKSKINAALNEKFTI